MKLPASYGEAARRYFRKACEDDIWARYRSAARRLLSAICFREHACATLEKTGTALLPPIGYYYGVYHVGIAVLSLDYGTELRELRLMRHKRLRNLIENRLAMRRVLSNDFLQGLDRCRQYREYANYVFGGRMQRDSEFDALQIVPNLYSETGILFSEAVELILALSDVTYRDGLSPGPLQQLIGDHFGDDIIRRYLCRSDEGRVWNYLIEKGLTT